jgi:hypothetical protein
MKGDPGPRADGAAFAVHGKKAVKWRRSPYWTVPAASGAKVAVPILRIRVANIAGSGEQLCNVIKSVPVGELPQKRAASLCGTIRLNPGLGMFSALV